MISSQACGFSQRPYHAVAMLSIGSHELGGVIQLRLRKAKKNLIQVIEPDKRTFHLPPADVEKDRMYLLLVTHTVETICLSTGGSHTVRVLL